MWAWLLAALTLGAAPIIARAETAQPAFHDPGGRISFSIPAGWRVADGSLTDDMVTVVASTTCGTFMLSIEAVQADTTLDQYASDAAARLQRGPSDVAALPTKAVSRTLGGELARADVFEAIGCGMPIFIYQLIAIHDGSGYILTFATASAEKDDYFAQARMVLDTFAFLMVPQ